MLKDIPQNDRRELIFDLITCPLDADDRELAGYWLQCTRRILRGKNIPDPQFETETLLGCEQQYRAWDVNHQLKMRLGIQDDSFEQREAICRRIKELMEAEKNEYIRCCTQCGKELPAGWRYNLCESCFTMKKYFS